MQTLTVRLGYLWVTRAIFPQREGKSYNSHDANNDAGAGGKQLPH